jgi:hypothetical protein
MSLSLAKTAEMSLSLAKTEDESQVARSAVDKKESQERKAR